MRSIWLALILPTLFVVATEGQPAKVSPMDLNAWQGTWVLDLMRSGLTPADAERRVINVGPTWVRVDVHRAASAQPVALFYNLDGSANINAFGPDTAVTKLTRDGEYVVLETVFTVNKQAVTLNERVPIVPGLDLPVEVMLRVEHGYQGVAPAGVRTAPNVANATKFFVKQ